MTISSTVHTEPAWRASAARTCFFTGSRYVPRLVSGNTDVRHVVEPTVTSTRSDPKPASR